MLSKLTFNWLLSLFQNSCRKTTTRKLSIFCQLSRTISRDQLKGLSTKSKLPKEKIFSLEPNLSEELILLKKPNSHKKTKLKIQSSQITKKPPKITCKAFAESFLPSIKVKWVLLLIVKIPSIRPLPFTKK